MCLGSRGRLEHRGREESFQGRANLDKKVAPDPVGGVMGIGEGSRILKGERWGKINTTFFSGKTRTVNQKVPAPSLSPEGNLPGSSFQTKPITVSGSAVLF